MHDTTGHGGLVFADLRGPENFFGVDGLPGVELTPYLECALPFGVARATVTARLYGMHSRWRGGGAVSCLVARAGVCPVGRSGACMSARSTRARSLSALAGSTVVRSRAVVSAETPYDAVFPTRNGTWQQVNNIERRWRQIRLETGLDWVTPHTFRKTVATLIAERVSSETASQQLGHSSPAITREFYISKPAIAADVAHVLQELSDPSGTEDHANTWRISGE